MKKHKTGHYRNGRNESRKHLALVKSKQERVSGLEALIEMWEQSEDYDYVRGLKYRLNAAKSQLKVMM